MMKIVRGVVIFSKSDHPHCRRATSKEVLFGKLHAVRNVAFAYKTHLHDDHSLRRMNTSDWGNSQWSPHAINMSGASSGHEPAEPSQAKMTGFLAALVRLAILRPRLGWNGGCGSCGQ